MRLSDVLGQDRALSILRRGLRSGRTPHAYLLAGPDGVGKERAARALAARFLCEAAIAPDADACGACPACSLLAAGNHPDFHVIDRALQKFHPDPNIRRQRGLVLGIDLVRHFLIAAASASPSRGRARVFLVREAERMSEPAQNALLKTLEEPPGASRLLLVTPSADRLLATIRSRCQIVPFAALPADLVARLLTQDHGVPPPAAASLARLSGGRIGAALHWQRIGLMQSVAALAQALAAGAAEDPEAFAKQLVAESEALLEREQKQATRDDDEAGEAEGGVSADAADSAADGDEGDSAADAAAGGKKRSAGDAQRGMLKLLLAAVAALCRDALVARAAAGGEALAARASLGRDALASPGFAAATASTAAPAALLPDFCAAASRLAARLSAETLDRSVSAAVAAEAMIDRNVAVQLACESLATTLAAGA